MSTIISFSPSTKIASADVNSNFSNLANGSAMQAPNFAGADLITTFTASGLYDNGSQKGTYNIDWTKCDRQKVTCDHTGNLTLTYSGAVAGQILVLIVIEDGTGASTVTLPASKWPSGSAMAFTTTASAINTISVLYDGTNYLTQGAPGYA
jgi:hypothetical protein